MNPQKKKENLTEKDTAWIIINALIYLSIFRFFSSFSDFCMYAFGKFYDLNSFSEWISELCRFFFKLAPPIIAWLLWMLLPFKNILKIKRNIWLRFLLFLALWFSVIFSYLKFIK